MKKITTLLLAMTMLFSLASCGSNNSAETSAESTAVGTENSSSEESVSEKETTESAEAQSDNNKTTSTETDNTRVLVAYFSATGTTKGVAQEMASALSADLYEIVPEEPYTDDDLNYNDDNSRSTIEMNDASARPEISGSVENMNQYDIVFLGYPIWWYDAPRIISTFVESYDFSGKTIVPFCTSGGSGIGSSGANLEKLTNGATWLSGERFSGSTSHAEIVDWLNGLGLDLTAE